MSSRIRPAILGALLVAGAALAASLAQQRAGTAFDTSLVPAFQVAGTPIQSLDRLVARVVPVDALDERDLGRVLRKRYDARANPRDPTFVYLNDLVAHLSEQRRKPFDYRVYVLASPVPNAMALPGGEILVTRGLLGALHSESQVAAVLGHEIGHVELSHCFDAVKFELLARKLRVAPLGRIADITERLLIHHAFSKTEEAEADDYGYELLLRTPYDPRGEGRAFAALLAWRKSHGVPGVGPDADPFRDYFLSHPPLELRRDEYLARAGAWWRAHPREVRYRGAVNLQRRKSYYSGLHPADEWTGPQGASGVGLQAPPGGARSEAKPS